MLRTPAILPENSQIAEQSPAFMLVFVLLPRSIFHLHASMTWNIDFGNLYFKNPLDLASTLCYDYNAVCDWQAVADENRIHYINIFEEVKA